MTNKPEQNKILCIVKSHKEVNNSKVISNVIGNILANSLGSVGGRIVNDFTLTLTDKNLYIDGNSYSTWGGVPETNNEEIIPIKDIASFNVEEENKENVITIITNVNARKIKFICNNEDEHKMATKMYELIPGLK